MLPDGFVRPVIYFLGLALTAQLLHAVVERPRDAQLPEREPAVDLVDNPIPDPSGADPLYPPNHTFDGKTTALGQVTNHDFETAAGSVGTPATNHDLETAPSTVATFTNGDFETGTFTGWTVAGSPTIASDANQGYYARMSGSTHKITSSAVTVPSTAQALVYDIGYLNTTNYSWIKVYVLTGASYGTATLLRDDSCNSCGYWSTSYVDITAYRTQSVKFRFDVYSTGHPAGIPGPWEMPGGDDGDDGDESDETCRSGSIDVTKKARAHVIRVPHVGRLGHPSAAARHKCLV